MLLEREEAKKKFEKRSNTEKNNEKENTHA